MKELKLFDRLFQIEHDLNPFKPIETLNRVKGNIISFNQFFQISNQIQNIH